MNELNSELGVIDWRPIFVVILSFSFLAIAVRRAKNLFHPIVIFTMAWVFSGPLAGVLEAEKIVKHDWMTISLAMAFYSSFFIVSLVVVSPANNESLTNLNQNLTEKISNINLWIGIASVLVAGEFLRQLYNVDFSIQDWWAYSTGPRFGRPWGRSRIGGADFLLTLWGLIYGIAGPLIGFMVPFAKKTQLWLAIAVFTLQLFLAFSSGSRTPFVMAIGTFAAACFIVDGFRFKALTMGSALFLIAAVFFANLMVDTRATGITESENYFSMSSWIPKTDDNFPRFMRIIELDFQGEPKPPPEPFLKSTFLNFIPRFFWPGKPVLEQSYWGGWRKYYTTVSLSGELVCFLGYIGGFLAALGLGSILFKALCWQYSRSKNVVDWGIYFYCAFVLYMLFRSLMNFSVFLCPVLFVYLIRFLANQRVAPARDGA